MSYMERKGPWVRHRKDACPKCNGNLIEFDIIVSSAIMIAETFCESCDYNITNSEENTNENIHK